MSWSRCNPTVSDHCHCSRCRRHVQSTRLCLKSLETQHSWFIVIYIYIYIYCVYIYTHIVYIYIVYICIYIYIEIERVFIVDYHLVVYRFIVYTVAYIVFTVVHHFPTQHGNTESILLLETLLSPLDKTGQNVDTRSAVSQAP
jgi:hypothetical protein